jgi:hypothetical protein
MTIVAKVLDQRTILEEDHEDVDGVPGQRLEQAAQRQLRATQPRCVVQDDHP